MSRDFPQELVDYVIDKLGEPSDASEPHKISNYSTVSRKWVKRTQEYHFELLHFECQEDMERWKRVIELGSSCVSQHVRTLHWIGINALGDFKDHLAALTKVKTAEFEGCGFFSSPHDVGILRRIGSSLVELEIHDTKTTPAIMASFLRGLPNLRRFHALHLEIELNDDSEPASLDDIQFFKGANDFRFLLRGHSKPGMLAWVPPSARFSNLGIGTQCIEHDPGLVQRWINSSRETLRHFCIDWDPDLWHPEPTFTNRLDLSKCNFLETLQLPLSLNKPEFVADVILPSISSPALSTVVLYLEEAGDREVLPAQRWDALEKHLCRLAKQFWIINGRKMTVEIDLNAQGDEEVLDQFREHSPMPNLVEEATIVYLLSEALPQC